MTNTTSLLCSQLKCNGHGACLDGSCYCIWPYVLDDCGHRLDDASTYPVWHYCFLVTQCILIIVFVVRIFQLWRHALQNQLHATGNGSMLPDKHFMGGIPYVLRVGCQPNVITMILILCSSLTFMIYLIDPFDVQALMPPAVNAFLQAVTYLFLILASAMTGRIFLHVHARAEATARPHLKRYDFAVTCIAILYIAAMVRSSSVSLRHSFVANASLFVYNNRYLPCTKQVN
jgi:hypothetical protein